MTNEMMYDSGSCDEIYSESLESQLNKAIQLIENIGDHDKINEMLNNRSMKIFDTEEELNKWKAFSLKEKFEFMQEHLKNISANK